MPFFSKSEIIQRMKEKRAELGPDAARADVNLALIILGAALFEKRLWSGNDYGEHPLMVGLHNTRSSAKVIIGLLHDVVEDSDWTIDDLREAGFSERVLAGVDAMTHREGELYYDSIERCSLNPDGVDKKIEDLSHNLDMSRSENFAGVKDNNRINKYILARAYLVEVKRGLTAPGTKMPDFVRSRDDFKSDPTASGLLNDYSSHRKRPAPGSAPSLHP